LPCPPKAALNSKREPEEKNGRVVFLPEEKVRKEKGLHPLKKCLVEVQAAKMRHLPLRARKRRVVHSKTGPAYTGFQQE